VIARGQRAFHGQHGKNVIFHQRAESLQFGQRQLRQVDALGFGRLDGQADGFVRVAEGQALLGPGSRRGRWRWRSPGSARPSHVLGLTVMPPAMSAKMRRVSVTVSTASNSGSLSSWLSLL
jgi:hypothetical protein